MKSEAQVYAAAYAEARAGIAQANVTIDAALEVMRDPSVASCSSMEQQVATVAKFLMMTGDVDAGLVAAAVAIVRLAGRDTVLR